MNFLNCAQKKNGTSELDAKDAIVCCELAQTSSAKKKQIPAQKKN